MGGGGTTQRQRPLPLRKGQNANRLPAYLGHTSATFRQHPHGRIHVDRSVNTSRRRPGKCSIRDCWRGFGDVGSGDLQGNNRSLSASASSRFHHVYNLSNEGWNRTRDNTQIQRERTPPSILDVESNHLIKCRPIFSGYLPESRQPRNRLAPLPLLRCKMLELIRNTGTWANQTHFPPQHIDDLRKFIKPRGPQQPSPRDDPGVAPRFQLLHRRPRLHQLREVIPMRHHRRAHVHGTKLENMKRASALADSLLSKENGAARSKGSQDRRKKSAKREERQSRYTAHQIDCPLPDWQPKSTNAPIRRRFVMPSIGFRHRRMGVIHQKKLR